MPATRWPAWTSGSGPSPLPSRAGRRLRSARPRSTTTTSGRCAGWASPPTGCPSCSAATRRAKVLQPPPEPPRICTQTAITIAPDTGARYRQDLPYGSPAWHKSYATLRNTIEGLNGLIKDPAHQALAQPARRRVRGIAAQSIFTALLLLAANIRKIRAWRALTTNDKTRITRRARRRRTSQRDYLPDG